MEAKLKSGSGVTNKLSKHSSHKKLNARKFKNLDIFGRKVNLTLMGKDVFKTNFGAIITILVIGSMTGYTIYQAY